MTALDDLITATTRRLMDDGKIIEAGWQVYRMTVLPKDASAIQISETRLAFFAGAQHLFGSIMTALDPGPDETAADMRRMEQISAELDAFADVLKLRISEPKGSG